MTADRPTSQAVAAAVAKWETGKLDYGRRDCAQFAGYVVRILTGTDHLAGIRYAGEDEAAQLLKEHGGLGHAVTAITGLTPASRLDLYPGAVVQWRHAGTDGLGIALDRFANHAAVLNHAGAVIEAPGRLIVQGWNLWRA